MSMRINNNLMAMNTHRQLGINADAGAKSIEKLSSGYRINRAGDDAAGLSISEKMRGQIRGLNQASRNAQDGISMIQTAEGALNESQAILQRMRELSVQASNDTNVEIDRGAIQNEITQLTSELDRIGNTTEFNTQSLLKGDGGVALAESGAADAANITTVAGATAHTEATQATTIGVLSSADSGGSFKFQLNGETITVNVLQATTKSDGSALTDGEGEVDTSTGTENSITVRFNDTSTDVTEAKTATLLASAVNEVISKNSTLSGNYSASAATDQLTIAATAGGDFEGKLGAIGASSSTGVADAAAAGTASVGTTTHTQESKTINMDGYLDGANAAAKDVQLNALVGKGMTINGQAIEFYDSTKGAYEGEAIGVAINTALEAADADKGDALAKAIADTVGSQIDGVTVTASADDVVITDSKYEGVAGKDSVTTVDGSVQEEFKATFQIGANQTQTMEIKIGDMRAEALGVTGLDLSTSEGAQEAITTINNAIEKVSAQRSELGAFQNRLEHTIKNLDTSAENLQSSESRIRDVDMAQEMMTYTKNNILQQAAQAMLAQANQAPQGVLQLLR